MIITMVTIWTVRVSAPMNLSDRLAPKNFALSMLATSSCVKTPTVCSLETLFSTVNSAKKNGDWARIGKQDDSGLVLCSL